MNATDEIDEAIVHHGEAQHGRAAAGPHRMTRRGWRDVLSRVVREVIDDKIAMVSAAVAFYAMLAFFPAMVAAIATYGIVFDAAEVRQQLRELATYLPYTAATLIGEQLHRFASASVTELGSGLVLGLLGALWTASSAFAALLEAVNLAYDEAESPCFVRLRLQAFRFTAGALVGGAVVLALLMAIGSVAGDGAIGTGLRWLLLAMAAIGGLSVLYRRGPVRTPPQWRWVTTGAIVATLLCLVTTALLAIYVQRITDYEATYGAIGGAIVLMLWLFTSAFAVLLGAELNAELELQVAVDTTVGPARPVGRRGARKADEVAPLSVSPP